MPEHPLADLPAVKSGQGGRNLLVRLVVLTPAGQPGPITQQSPQRMGEEAQQVGQGRLPVGGQGGQADRDRCGRSVRLDPWSRRSGPSAAQRGPVEAEGAPVVNEFIGEEVATVERLQRVLHGEGAVCRRLVRGSRGQVDGVEQLADRNGWWSLLSGARVPT